MLPLRIGFGYDVHRFAPEGKLILGGVQITDEMGIEAHSDGDVLLHAVCDALLGACALGDIGHHFPDNDPRFKGISSLDLLGRTRELIGAAGYEAGNLDMTIVLEKPKVAPFIDRIRNEIASCLNIPIERISVKATTSERLGFVGAELGIEAYAVATVVPLGKI